MLKQLLKALKKFEEFSQFCSTPGVSRQGETPERQESSFVHVLTSM